jgi:hypothetical protein
VVTEAEREVADPLAIEVDPAVARAAVETVPFWFHTFALNRAEGIYTPGAARTAPRFYGSRPFAQQRRVNFARDPSNARAGKPRRRHSCASGSRCEAELRERPPEGGLIPNL